MSLAAKIVGNLACQQNSYLWDLQTTVISCVETAASTTDTKRTKKNKEKEQKNQVMTPTANDVGDEKVWEIECEDSVLFPEGGGQPSDHGTIVTLEQPNDSIPITTVQRQGLRAIIFSPRPLVPGTKLTQHVDSCRRMDHMQQHTGQHLLSAVMDSYPGLETLGWSMGASPNMNYVELGRKPTDAEIVEIQDRCNKFIIQNKPVSVSTPLDVKHDSLPEDYDKEQGIVRVITIDGIDSNPCCGTHLSQTSHIGLILLHHTQPIRGTNTRLFFSCGARATSLATSSIHANRLIAAILSSGTAPKELNMRATQVTTSLRDALRAKRKLETEVASYIAANVIRDGLTWVHRADGDLNFLTDVVAAIPTPNLPGALVLAAGAGADGGSVLIVGAEADMVQATASKAITALENLKGGGKGLRWQGKAKMWQKGDIEVLKNIAQGST
ncbi:ThrRS/AlaRS common domain-containing protein [Ceratobasidium sp. AG-I]|nr:ThrRS/AlaRS common domain-containing protein [Ceratobasidium sp. AG-I]